MSQHRNGTHQTGTTAPFGDQKPQEHPQRRRAPLRARPSRAATVDQDEVPQGAGIQHARVLAKAPEQLSDGYVVVVERSVRGAAVLTHPLTERLQQRRFRVDWLGLSNGRFVALQIPQVQSNASQGVGGMCTRIPAAAASL